MALRPLLGLGGGSCSGKGRIAEEIVDLVGPELLVLRLDDYYRDRPELNHRERAGLNYDEPAAFETELLAQHLDALQRGQEIDLPSYDFKTHRRAKATRRIAPRPRILIEGILVLAIDSIVARCTHTVFVEASTDLRLQRRVARDTTERARDPSDVRRQFEQHVVPMHDRWIAPSASLADLRIDGNRPPRKSAQRILDWWTES